MNESQREAWQNLHENLFLYGASENLSTLYYEDIGGNAYSFSKI